MRLSGDMDSLDPDSQATNQLASRIACPYGQLHPEPKQNNAMRKSAHTYREIELVFIATTHHHICDCIASPVNEIFDCIDSPVDF